MLGSFGHLQLASHFIVAKGEPSIESPAGGLHETRGHTLKVRATHDLPEGVFCLVEVIC